MKTTFGQRIAAVVLGEQLGISPGRAMKRYIQGKVIDPWWEKAADELLRSSIERVGASALEDPPTPESGNVH